APRPFPAEPADGLDGARGIGKHDLAEPRAEHGRDRALEVRRHAQDGRQERSAVAVPAEQAGDAPGASLVARLELAQRFHPRAKLGDAIARVGTGLRPPGLVVCELPCGLDQGSALALQPRPFGPERVQPLSKSVRSAGVLFQPGAELALLAFELPPLALDLDAAALQSLREILKARLFGPGAHHRVLGLLHGLFEGQSSAAELVE